MLIRISLLYNRVKLNMFLSYLKDFFSLKKSFFATMIKTKIAKNKVIRKALIENLLKSNKTTTIKKIINIYKCKNYKCINKSKEKCYLNNNKHYKLNLKNVKN